VNFEILEHPADIGFRARGATEPELFANCAHALVSIILDCRDVRPTERFGVCADGSDYESLLVNFLNEVLYFVDGRRIALGRFDIGRLDENGIECVAWGEPRNLERHPPKLVVKAVTYHQLSVRRDDQGWVADVYVDI